MGLLRSLLAPPSLEASPRAEQRGSSVQIDSVACVHAGSLRDGGRTSPRVLLETARNSSPESPSVIHSLLVKSMIRFAMERPPCSPPSTRDTPTSSVLLPSALAFSAWNIPLPGLLETRLCWPFKCHFLGDNRPDHTPRRRPPSPPAVSSIAPSEALPTLIALRTYHLPANLFMLCLSH